MLQQMATTGVEPAPALALAPAPATTQPRALPSGEAGKMGEGQALRANEQQEQRLKQEGGAAPGPSPPLIAPPAVGGMLICGHEQERQRAWLEERLLEYEEELKKK